MATATDSSRVITGYLTGLYSKYTDRLRPVRRISISFHHVRERGLEQYDLFNDPAILERDRKLQTAVLEIKKKFGKNAVLRGMDLLSAATTRQRNEQIGGHRSGE